MNQRANPNNSYNINNHFLWYEKEEYDNRCLSFCFNKEEDEI